MLKDSKIYTYEYEVLEDLANILKDAMYGEANMADLENIRRQVDAWVMSDNEKQAILTLIDSIEETISELQSCSINESTVSEAEAQETEPTKDNGVTKVADVISAVKPLASFGKQLMNATDEDGGIDEDTLCKAIKKAEEDANGVGRSVVEDYKKVVSIVKKVVVTHGFCHYSGTKEANGLVDFMWFCSAVFSAARFIPRHSAYDVVEKFSNTANQYVETYHLGGVHKKAAVEIVDTLTNVLSRAY